MPTFFLKKLSLFLLLGDYLVINFFYIFWTSYYFSSVSGPLNSNNFISSLLMMNLRWFFISSFTKTYQRFYFTDSTIHFRNLTKSFFFFIIMCFLFFDTITYNILSNEKVLNFFLYYSLSILIFMVLNRIVLLFIRRTNRNKIYSSINTILVGKNNFTDTIFNNPEIRASLGIKGYYTLNEETNEEHLLGNLDLFFNDLKSKKIDNIVLCDDTINNELYSKIINIAEQKMIRTYIIPDFKHFSLNVNTIDILHGVPIMKAMPEPLDNFENQFIKRIFDVIFSLSVIIFLLSWLTPILALLIKIESKGPVFFKQNRSGLKNKNFMCLKFRSMKVNKQSDFKAASKDDNRITKIGAFIRKTSIDELPQFFNVLMGQMSVVGPRPHMLSQTDKYSTIMDKYMVRHFIKPGITGWAQVMGARGEIYKDEDMEKRIEKDIWYIQNWSLFLDFKIIFLTIYNVIKGDKQAY